MGTHILKHDACQAGYYNMSNTTHYYWASCGQIEITSIDVNDKKVTGKFNFTIYIDNQEHIISNDEFSIQNN